MAMDGITGSDVPPFRRSLVAAARVMTRVGSGALGGKAEGLRLIRKAVLAEISAQEHRDWDIDVPWTTVLTTDVFDEFMHLNGLWPLVETADSDERLALAFQRAEIPARFVGDLRALAAGLHQPLAVRSSSLLEDRLAHPFAGVYATKMIPNDSPDPGKRFGRLTEAIKLVYASTFMSRARSYQRSVGAAPRDEAMAVVLQKIVGASHGTRFYPTLSGVGRSYNFYPVGRARPEQGVVSLALGLGKTIVDGGVCWTYSPAYPTRPMPFGSVRDMLRNTQRRFWAVRMGPPTDHHPIDEDEYLQELSLKDAEYDDQLQLLASTYDASSDRLWPGIGHPGPRVLDCGGLLQIDDLRFNDLVRALIERAAAALGAAAEIEFSAVIGTRGQRRARLSMLQVRPMAVAGEEVAIADEDLRRGDVRLVSDAVIGNGRVYGIRDVVIVDPERFDASRTRDIAEEIAALDAQLRNRGREYLLIGFGRWGSSDPWLGIPVDFSQIRGARVIVEATLPTMHPDPSQGAHFFQNLIALKMLYMTVRAGHGERVDLSWFLDQPAVSAGAFVRHVRAVSSLEILADGRTGRGVIRAP